MRRSSSEKLPSPVNSPDFVAAEMIVRVFIRFEDASSSVLVFFESASLTRLLQGQNSSSLQSLRRDKRCHLGGVSVLSEGRLWRRQDSVSA